jgi:glycosyltransferase involved in cell wall biosynthesis
MLVRNGATVLPRALRPLRGLVKEVCYTDDASTDDTRQVIESLCHELQCACTQFRLYPIEGLTHFKDAPETWERWVPGPFSEALVLRNWSVARNASLKLCTGDYVMKLDADDEVLNPDDVARVIEQLDARPDINEVMSPYEIMSGQAIERYQMYLRLWRNRQYKFDGVVHEALQIAGNCPPLMCMNGLTVRDWRDSPGANTRVAFRNFKVLLAEYERCRKLDCEMKTQELLDLAEEGTEVDSSFSLAVLQKHFDTNTCYQHIADRVNTIKGICFEKSLRFDEAITCYRLASHGSAKATLRLALLEWKTDASSWKETIKNTTDRLRREGLYFNGVTTTELKQVEGLLKQIQVEGLLKQISNGDSRDFSIALAKLGEDGANVSQ